MSVDVDPRRAAVLLMEEAERSGRGDFDAGWSERIDHLSTACERVARTYIAFLGTAILAKALDHRVDVLAVKARSDQPGAYSARSLCHNGLVPSAIRLGINLGTTGREPLNNMPFFRMHRLDDGTAILAGARPAFNMLCNIVRALQLLSSDEARTVLRSFIHVRRLRQPVYTSIGEQGLRSAEALTTALRHFVGANSEGGKRAQAAVAGLLDVAYGPDRVETGRVNDPSRRHPGDVCVRSAPGTSTFEKAFEVRDKLVQEHDVAIFARKCSTFNVREVVMAAVSPVQPHLSSHQMQDLGTSQEMTITVFVGWQDIVKQALFWAAPSSSNAAALACETIHARLIELEVSSDAVEQWVSLVEMT